MLSRAELIRQAWIQGNLEYLVRDYQLPLYRDMWAAINNKTVLKHVVNISRRFGKTHVATIVAVEFAIRNPRAQIRYAAPSNKEMREILSWIMPEILNDCPNDLKPTRKNDQWHFQNGSVITTAGVNNQNEDNLRGTSSHLNIVDEAGMIDRLKYLVSSVLMPQQLTVDGTLLMLSTPPPEPEHDYLAYYQDAKENDELTEYTVYDNTELMNDPIKLEAYKKEAGGENSATWKREYLCRFEIDTNRFIMPEWLQVKEQCIKIPRKDRLYRYWLKYAGMDLGFRHNTCLLFGYYDFDRAKLVIEREFVTKGEDVTSQSIANAVKAIEAELGYENTYRVSDNNNPILLNDISRMHDVQFVPTSKDDLDAMVNQTRLWIGASKLEVSPECRYLLGCLEHGVWDKHRKGFAESKKYGHYDGLAALIYMLRYVDVHTNPVPVGLDLKPEDVSFMPVQSRGGLNAQGLKTWSENLNNRIKRKRGVS